MVGNGYDAGFAERTFKQLEGFGSYGFPESHAASFALIAYASSWLKCHHPDVFACALLNAQPMGFYAPAQVVRDAQEHGVPVRPPCVNASAWDCTLEPAEGRWLAVRQGLRMVCGLSATDGARLVAARPAAGYRGVEEAWRRAGLSAGGLRRLAEADAFRGLGLGLDRRAALWAVRGLRERPLDLFAAADAQAGGPQPECHEPAVALDPMTAGREVAEDYRSVGLSLRAHPLAFMRSDLTALGYRPCRVLGTARDRSPVRLAGLVLVRQKPGSAKGTMFITVEDEGGIANLVVKPEVFERQRRLILTAGMLGAHGQVQRQGIVVHVVVERLDDLTPLLRGVGGRSTGEAAFPLPHGRGDEARRGSAPDARDGPALGTRGPRDIYVPELAQSAAPPIRVPTRDFR